MKILYRNRISWADIALMGGTALFLFGLAVWGFCNPELFTGEDRYAPYVLVGVGVLSIVLLLTNIPKWVGVTQQFLIVRTSVRTIRIPLNEITSVEPCTHSSLNKASGFRFGGINISVGKYYSPRLGRFEIITSSRSNMVLIATRSGRKIVINCPIDTLKKHIDTAK